MRRLSWPSRRWRLGRLDDVGGRGLGGGRGVLACRGELLAELGDDLLEGGEFRLQGIDSRLESSAIGAADRVLGSHGARLYMPCNGGTTPVNGAPAELRKMGPEGFARPDAWRWPWPRRSGRRRGGASCPSIPWAGRRSGRAGGRGAWPRRCGSPAGGSPLSQAIMSRSRNRPFGEARAPLVLLRLITTSRSCGSGFSTSTRGERSMMPCRSAQRNARWTARQNPCLVVGDHSAWASQICVRWMRLQPGDGERPGDRPWRRPRRWRRYHS